MRFLVVTGQSGAGKSQVASILEDIGFYCVDNLPPDLLMHFTEVCLATTGRYEKVAVVSDIRANKSFDGLLSSLELLDQKGLNYSIVYVEADNDAIIHRYKESRRTHPLSRDGTPLSAAVEKEKLLLRQLRQRADYILDTTAQSTAQLRQELIAIFQKEDPQRAMAVSVMSFGYKYGIPPEADLVFDVRFLPNPYYIDELRRKTGLDQDVQDFLFSYQTTHDYIRRLEDLIVYSLPFYFEEGKTTLTIAVGCTGGRHRSTVVANEIGKCVEKRGYPVTVHHRDIQRG